jgi:hypothetical protein
MAQATAPILDSTVETSAGNSEVGSSCSPVMRPNAVNKGLPRVREPHAKEVIRCGMGRFVFRKVALHFRGTAICPTMRVGAARARQCIEPWSNQH